MTTTPDPASALLAEALALHHGPSYFAGLMDVTIIGETPEHVAQRLLADSPALRAALELGIAWHRAEAALPEGWVLKELRLHDDVSGWGAEAFNTTGVGRYRHMGYGPTPTAALTALAEALEARQQSHEVTTR